MKWYQSKTVWAGLTALVGGVGAYFQTKDVNVLATSILGAIMIVLRFVTKQPIE